jgi:hypothetical protein
LAFFGAAVIYALAGIALGMTMGATNDHTLMPVHAHINLLGWVSLALMGGFYGLAGAQTPGKLAWLSFVLVNVGNLVSLPLLAKLLLGDQSVVPMMAGGEAVIMLGMLIFGASIVVVARGSLART